MSLTDAQKASRNFKKLTGVAETNISRDFFEESFSSNINVLMNDVWQEADLIPATAPVLVADAVSGIVQYKEDLVLTAVAGTTNSFQNDLLKDAIPFNFGDGSYVYSLKDSLGNAINFGQGDWLVDPVAGVVSFYGSVPSNMPPKISFYKYIGNKGLSSINELDYRSLASETVSRTIYLATTGNDTTGDGSVGNPFFSVHRALKDIKPSIYGVFVYIKMAYGDYDYSALGDITIDKMGEKSTISIRNIDNTNTLTYKSLGTPITGNFVDVQTNPNRHTVSVNPTWTVDSLVGKWVKVNSVHSGTTPSDDYKYLPIVANGADWVETPVNASWADSNKWDSFEIVEHKTTVNLGSNNIFITKDAVSIAFYRMTLQTTGNISSGYNVAVNSRKSVPVNMYLKNVGIAASDFTVPATQFDTCSIVVTNYIYARHIASSSVNSSTTDIAITCLDSDFISIGSCAIRLMAGSKSYTGIKSYSKPFLSDNYFINCLYAVNVGSSKDSILYSSFNFRDVDYFIYAFQNHNISSYNGLYGGFYDISFITEPGVARITLDGTTEADNYYDAETGLNALAIAPDAKKFMKTLVQVTTTEMNALTDMTEGSEVYNTTEHASYYYDGTNWIVPNMTGKVDIVTSSTSIQNHSTVISNGASVLTHTLPAVAGITGRIYTIKNISSYSCILDADGAETIEGSLTAVIPSKASFTLQAYSGGWLLI